jgi:hypothetical protein
MVTAAPISAQAPPFREVLPNGTLRLHFHRAQTLAWDSNKRWIFLLMGTQSGKTSYGPHWLEREIREKGPGDYLAVTATFPLLRLKMKPEFLYVFSTLLKLGTWHENDKIFTSYERYHGAEAFRVIFGSATNPESIESATAKAAWLDELGQDQFRRGAWDAVLRRLSLAEGRILGTTTLYVWGWLKSEIYDPWKKGQLPDVDVIQADSITNPAFPRKEYQRAKDTLPDWKFNLFYRGLYAKPAGLIYDAFDEDVCKIPRFNLHKDWPRYVGHDFGPNNTAAVWYAQDPTTGWLYAYRVYRGGGLSAFDHAKEFKNLSEGENIIRRVGGARHEEGWRESFLNAGWPILKPREHEVEVGINRVYGWHKSNRLFVFDDLVEYLDEKSSYSRVLDDKYEPTDKIADKSSFHIMDAERYILSDFSPEMVEDQGKTVIYSVRDSRSEDFAKDPRHALVRSARG